MSKKKRKVHKNKTRLTETDLQKKPAHGRRANRFIFIAITVSLILGTVAMGASSWGSW